MAKRSESSPATHGTGLEPPRSNTAGDLPDNEVQPDLTGDSAAATASPKRGRGRPPKPKADSQPNGAVSAQPAGKPSGRPKRNKATGAASASAAVVKSGRGRPKRSNTLPATESLVTSAGGSRKRGRPKKDDVAAATVPAPTATAAAPAGKRGRKPKEVVATRTVGRPRKAREATTTTGQGAADPTELKKKAALLQKKVKQAADKLKIAISAIEEVQKIAAGM